jgi:hypothetical protein
VRAPWNNRPILAVIRVSNGFIARKKTETGNLTAAKLAVHKPTCQQCQYPETRGLGTGASEPLSRYNGQQLMELFTVPLG